MKTALFIHTDLNKIQSKEKIEDLLGPSDSIYCLPDILNSCQKHLNSSKIEVLDLTPDQKKSLNYNLMEYILAFGEKTIQGMSVYEHMNYERASFWHYQKFRVYFALNENMQQIELIKQLAKKYEHINLITSDSIFPKLKSLAYLPDNIQCIKLQNKKEPLNIHGILKYLIFIFLRFFIDLRLHKKISRAKNLFYDNAIRQSCLDFDLKTVKDNYYLGYLLKQLDNRNLLLREIPMPKIRGGVEYHFGKELYSKNPKIKPKRVFAESILIRAIFDKNIRIEKKRITNQLKKFYGLIEHDDQQIQSILIFEHLKRLHPSSVLFAYRYLVFKKLFRTHKNIKNILGADENSAHVKPIFDAAKKNSRTTFGIQHGTFNELHPSYIFTPFDQAHQIMTDYTIIWGEYWKNFLSDKSSYPSDNLLVCGQIRTDIIPKLLEHFMQNDKKNQDSKKILLFATQPQPDQQMRYKTAFDIISAIKDLKEIRLFIKLHPREEAQKEYYENILKECDVHNAYFTDNQDLYYLLASSDYIITSFSTVGTEAIYFNKPLLVYDPLEQDIQGYIKNGVGLRVKGPEDLKNTLENLLSQELGQDFHEIRQEFIQKYAYKIDGKVSERITNILSTTE